MERFSALLAGRGHAGERQRYAREHWRETVVAAGFLAWDGGRLPHGTWIVIGVATWALNELHLLDALVSAPTSGIHLIDLAQFSDMASLKVVFRLQTDVYNTPLVMKGCGEHIDSPVLVGFDAMQELRRMGGETC